MWPVGWGAASLTGWASETGESLIGHLTEHLTLIGCYRRGAGSAVILRPMRELSSKEVSLYCVYNRLETWHGQEIQGVGDTIRNVTQEFLVGLQVRKNCFFRAWTFKAK